MKPKFSEDPKEWRKAAWMSALGLAVFSSLLRWRRVLHNTTWVIILTALAVVAVAAAIQPRWFRSFYRFSNRLGFAISHLAGLAALSLFFIIVITPVSIIRRVIGKDSLHLQRRNVDTYWLPAPKKTPLDRMF
jgi:hypothetical protein